MRSSRILCARGRIRGVGAHGAGNCGTARGDLDCLAPRGELEIQGGFITSLRQETLLRESAAMLRKGRELPQRVFRTKCCFWTFTRRSIR